MQSYTTHPTRWYFQKERISKQWMAIFGNSGTVTKQAYHAFLKQVVCEVCNFNPFVLHRKIDISLIHKYFCPFFIKTQVKFCLQYILKVLKLNCLSYSRDSKTSIESIERKTMVSSI